MVAKSEDRKHRETILDSHTRRLRKLKEKQAYFGRNTPPEVLMEIEDVTAQIETAEAELAEPEDTIKYGRKYKGPRDDKSMLYALFEGQDLSGQDMRCIRSLHAMGIPGAKLSKANLSMADLRGTIMPMADLRWANLHKANLYDADLTEADLFGANLDQADLRFANLNEANLKYTNLRGVKIDENTQIEAKWRLVWQIVNQSRGRRSLRKADLSWADLRNVDFYKMNLRSANLDSADLSQANLSQANLVGANLFGADLAGADLQEADLSSARLGWAKLRDADLWQANLSNASYDKYTTWPKDFNPHEAGAIYVIVDDE